MENPKDIDFAYTIFSSNRPEALRRVLKDFSIPHEEGVGCYKGAREPIWAVRTPDFWDLYCASSEVSKLVANQECVLQVTGCNKQYAQLNWLSFSQKPTPLGCMHTVPDHVASKEDAWTYLPSSKAFWVARPGNPDRTPPPAGWQDDASKAKHKRWVHTLGVACREFETSITMEQDLHEVREHIKKHFGVQP